jgi:ubiquinone/menaquinone biosynthesis C-methylase UbiE
VAYGSQGVNPREYEIMRRMEDDYWWYRALHAQVMSIVGRKLAGTHDSAVLDAGCGTGGFLAALHGRFNYARLTGIDASSEAIHLTRERGLGVELVCGDVQTLPFADQCFDLIISLDVLSTDKLDDARALRELLRVLKTGRSLILNLPAFDCLQGAHDVAVNVGRRYTRPRLHTLLTRSGFEVEWLTYWNMLLFIPIAIWRRLSRLQTSRKPARSDLRQLPSWVNRIMAASVQYELRLASVFPLPVGTSILAVARRRS